MPEPKQPEDRILVAIQDRMALLRVEGRGSFKVSTAMKEFCSAAIDKGANQIVVDMTECVGMDSTFMGVLAGMSTRLKKIENGGVFLLNLSNRTLNLVTTLGLHHLLQAHASGDTPDALKNISFAPKNLDALKPAVDTRQDTARTMLEAHENLVEASPDNAPRFKDVLTYLREDLRKNSSEPDASP